MAGRRNEDAQIEFACDDCGHEFDMEGRFNAEGDFEPFDSNDLDCDECGGRTVPVDEEIKVVAQDA